MNHRRAESHALGGLSVARAHNASKKQNSLDQWTQEGQDAKCNQEGLQPAGHLRIRAQRAVIHRERKKRSLRAEREWTATEACSDGTLQHAPAPFPVPQPGLTKSAAWHAAPTKHAADETFRAIHQFFAASAKRSRSGWLASGTSAISRRYIHARAAPADP